MGYSGLASLGTGGFIGIGTYAVHYVMVEAKLPFIIALLAAILISVVIGLIVGFISLRIEGIYLVILTLALSEILRTLYSAIEPKLSLPAKDAILFGRKFASSKSLFLVSAVLVIIMIITSNLINSPTGRAMLAMKNSTAAAQAMGISLIKYRLMAFIICTAYASISGVLLMMVVRSADATDPTGYYALITSLNILAAVIIGGYKSIWGAVFGTFVMYGMEVVVFSQFEFLTKNPLIITLVSGVLVILVAMFYPGGLAQLLLEAKTKIKALIKKRKEGIYGKDLG
jgi:branched-chain amino acid transport system permease protein